jgi:hypothetical protein
MKRHEKNKLLMIDAVVSYLSGNQSVTANVPVIANRIAKLISIQDSIRNYEQLQSSIARVSSAKKAEAREKAEFAGNTFAGKLYSHGIETGNTEFTKKYEVTISDFRIIGDVILVTKLLEIRDDVRDNLNALGSHGITQEVYDEFAATVDNYVASVGNKETSYAERSAAVKSITALFDQASETLKTLDKLIEEYRTKNPNFFNGYKSARGIKDFGYRSKAVPEATQNPKEQ